MSFRTLFFTFLVLALSACTLPRPVISRPLAAGEVASIEGLVYSLPKSVVRIKTVNMVTSISPIEQVPDPRGRYVLEGQYLFATKDDFDFTVVNGLLTTVTCQQRRRATESGKSSGRCCQQPTAGRR